MRADLVDRWLIIRLAFRALVAHQWPMAHHPGSDGSLAPAAPARKEAWPEPAEREGNDMCYSVVSAAASDHNALCTSEWGGHYHQELVSALPWTKGRPTSCLRSAWVMA